MRRIREVPVVHGPADEEAVELLVHPGWRDAYPWLVQGITTATRGFDLRLFGPAAAGSVTDRWDTLRRATRFDHAFHARQVHGSFVARHRTPNHPGLSVVASADGHVTAEPGLLLTVAVADCVPVFLIESEVRAVAMIHAGWRGMAAGILDRGLRAIDELGGDRSRVEIHAGPHICDRCYEVGPEVHEALGFPPPASPTPVSLATALSRQARGLGVGEDRFTASELCSRCTDEGDIRFYSHRGGATGRQVGVIGMRPS